jgi:hypothetical protein
MLRPLDRGLKAVSGDFICLCSASAVKKGVASAVETLKWRREPRLTVDSVSGHTTSRMRYWNFECVRLSGGQE